MIVELIDVSSIEVVSCRREVVLIETYVYIHQQLHATDSLQTDVRAGVHDVSYSTPL